MSGIWVLKDTQTMIWVMRFIKEVLQVATAYALNLHINSYLHGTSSHPFSKIELDESSNST